MPLSPLLASRFSARHYKPEPISDEALKDILEAARWAPSSYNDQPWFFIVAKREDGEAFEKMLSCTGGNASWCKDASVLMACCARQNFSSKERINRHAWHDLGLSVMAMAVQGVSQGLQMREMAGIEPDKVRRLYKVPDTHDIATGLAIGFPAAPMPEDRYRKPLKDFVFEGEWGNSRSF